MPSAVDRLLEMKDRLIRDEKDLQTIKGRIQVYMKSLKNDFKCTTTDAGKKLLAKIDVEIEEMEREFEEGVAELENEYDWD